jgi:hypothetical protein
MKPISACNLTTFNEKAKRALVAIGLLEISLRTKPAYRRRWIFVERCNRPRLGYANS